jgi:hypothetical protein
MLSQLEKYNSAVNAFKLKFNCLPGDCPNASDFGFNAATNGNGNGAIGVCTNQATCVYNATDAFETVYFWYHLSSANLDAGGFTYPGSGAGLIGTDSPLAVMPSPGGSGGKSGWVVVSNPVFSPLAGGGSFPGHAFALTAVSTIPAMGYNPPWGSGGYSSADTYAIDAKVDDGLPTSGIVRAYIKDYQPGNSGVPYFNYDESGGTVGIGAGGPAAPVCVRNDTVPPQYNVQYSGNNQLGLCDIVVKAAF